MKVSYQSMKNFSLLLSCVSLLTLTDIVRADTLYLSNLSETTDGSESIRQLSNGVWVAQSFQTGNNTNGYTLESVSLSMSEGSESDVPLKLSLYSANRSNNEIGELKYVFTSTDPYDHTAGIKLWDAPDAAILGSNARYWLILESDTETGSYYWDYTSSLSATSLQNWLIPSTLTYATESGSGWDYNDGRPQKFSVNASAVPEPTVAMLVGFGTLAGLMLQGRRRLN